MCASSNADHLAGMNCLLENVTGGNAFGAWGHIQPVITERGKKRTLRPAKFYKPDKKSLVTLKQPSSIWYKKNVNKTMKSTINIKR